MIEDGHVWTHSIGYVYKHSSTLNTLLQFVTFPYLRIKEIRIFNLRNGKI